MTIGFERISDDVSSSSSLSTPRWQNPQRVMCGSSTASRSSWSQWQSILWAIVHGFFSWLYVIYFALTRAA